MRNRGEALDRRAKQAAERLGFGLAQLRVLGRDMRDRAVMLAKLLTGGRPRSRARGCCVAVYGERLSQRPHPIGQRRGRDNRPVPALKLADLTAGELGDGLGSGSLGQEAQGAGGQVVIGVLEGTAASIGDREQPRRPAATAVAVDPGDSGLDHSVLPQMIEVTPDGGRREPQRSPQCCSGHRAVFQDQPGDTGARALLGASA
jgi:hypothetical protein